MGGMQNMPGMAPPVAGVPGMAPPGVTPFMDPTAKKSPSNSLTNESLPSVVSQ